MACASSPPTTPALCQSPHRQLAEKRGFPRPEFCDHCCVGIRNAVLVWLRTPGRKDAFGVEQIFRAVGYAMQSAEMPAATQGGIGVFRLLKRKVFGQSNDAVELRPVCLQAIQVHLRQRHRSDAALADECSQFTGVQEREVFCSGEAPDGRSRGRAERRFPSWRWAPRQNRRKCNRGRCIERDIDSAKSHKIGELPVRRGKQHLELGVGELQTHRCQGRGRHLLSHASWRRRRSLLRHRQSRQKLKPESAAQTRHGAAGAFACAYLLRFHRRV